MRRLFAAIIGVFGLFVTATPATANDVVRVPNLAPPATYSGVCSFDFSSSAVINDEKVTSFYDNKGTLVKQITSGRLVVVWTNLSTGKAISTNLSGPVSISFNPDATATVHVLGPQVFLQPVSAALGLAPISHLFIGTGETEYDVSFSPLGIALVSKVGQFRNMCDLLS